MTSQSALYQSLESRYADLLRLHQLGQPTLAKQHYQHILKADHQNPHIFRLFGVTANRYGQYGMAIRLLKKATEYATQEPQFFLELAIAYRNANMPQKAFACFEKVFALRLEGETVHSAYADLLADTDQLEEAIYHYQIALRHAPGHLGIQQKLAETLLLLHKYPEANEVLDKLLAKNPLETATIALKIIAAQTLGNEQYVDEMTAQEHVIRSTSIASHAEYHESVTGNLISFVRQHPSLSRNLDNISTVNGSQTQGNLLQDQSQSARKLKRLIEQATRSHIDSLPPANHPHAAACPDEFHIESWGVILQQGGFQEAHIHRSGWLSGVIYLDIPESVQQNDHQHGCIAFGQAPSKYYHSGALPEPTSVIRPENGLIVTFPSYLWHKTIPFQSKDERICIAFDIVPVRAKG